MDWWLWTTHASTWSRTLLRACDDKKKIFPAQPWIMEIREISFVARREKFKSGKYWNADGCWSKKLRSNPSWKLKLNKESWESGKRWKKLLPSLDISQFSRESLRDFPQKSLWRGNFDYLNWLSTARNKNEFSFLEKKKARQSIQVSRIFCLDS